MTKSSYSTPNKFLTQEFIQLHRFVILTQTFSENVFVTKNEMDIKKIRAQYFASKKKQN